MAPKNSSKRGAGGTPAQPNTRAAPTHAPGTPDKRAAIGEAPIDDDCERCALYIGTPKWRDCDAVFTEGQQQRYQRCAGPNHECRAMNKLMGAEYNRILRALSEHAGIMEDADASQEDKDAATKVKDDLIAAWPKKLKAFQRNRHQVAPRNSTAASKKRKLNAGGAQATSTGGSSEAIAANTQALTGLFELGRAYLATKTNADLTRADHAMAGLRARFADELEEEFAADDDDDDAPGSGEE